MARIVRHESERDVTLSIAAMSLHAQVVTATGQHRRVELGNSIATMDAGQRTSTAPVKNMGDLLTAQMTGVQVSDPNLAGVASRIRIRGQSSLSLNNDPIYIIDGARMTSATGGASTGGVSYIATTGAGAASVPSRVNDINPEEIESIEVVKGPSAATLYGTDAATKFGAAEFLADGGNRMQPRQVAGREFHCRVRMRDARRAHAQVAAGRAGRDEQRPACRCQPRPPRGGPGTTRRAV